ncbi:MAG: 8-amino-7-oxononanoate synthase [Polyangiaceae bacterium]|jgi:8-amino-7-oxononanoate synthase|nr:8-amino-7-oxononanoate synthase [Polyangiaceae bacterium]
MIPSWVANELAQLQEANALRALRVVEGPVGPVLRVEGRDVFCFSSNDYLGFASDPRLANAAGDAARQLGTGAGSSRLITGTLALHTTLEQELAAFKGAQSALLFGTGYQANVGVLQGLMREGVIFSDVLNHASIVDGCRLARASVQVYAHADMGHLERLLRAHQTAPRKLVVTDGVFSMDGDLAPLDSIAELAEAHGALVLVDDAHATGVLGGGHGTGRHFGLDTSTLIQMGTLGKALGSFGAFVACAKPVRDLLLNRARSFVYTTAPPPAVLAASMAALRLLRDEPQLVAQLAANAALLRNGLREAGFAVTTDPTPIVPVVLGDNARALRWAARLWELGFWVQAIRPPTVPPGSARLRITVSAAHHAQQIESLCQALADLAASEREKGQHESHA